MNCIICGNPIDENRPHREYHFCKRCRPKNRPDSTRTYEREGVLYNRYEIYTKGFQDGTVFYRRVANGYKQRYIFKDGKVVTYPVGKASGYKTEDLPWIYEWLKEHQPTTTSELGRLIYKDVRLPSTYGQRILDALDRAGYLTTEENNKIYAYDATAG